MNFNGGPIISLESLSAFANSECIVILYLEQKETKGTKKEKYDPIP